MTDDLRQLLALGDLDGLVRAVDRLARGGDWETLAWLRDRCAAAAEETGKQLWGAAQYADYRTALDAPPRIAAAVVTPGSGRFALGPLTEVVAQHHDFDALAEHLPSRVVASTVAHERIIRGEDLRDDPRAALDEHDLPGRLQPWEPVYATPVYRPDEVLADGPPAPVAVPLDDPRPGRPRSHPDVERALYDLVRPWTVQSTGEAHVAVVDGDAAAAVAAVTVGGVAWSEVSVPEALGHVVWAAASGGALGRRRGMAAGRSAAWWLAHVLTGLDWPADPDELEYRLEERRWFVFEHAGQPSGWRLALAVEDPDRGWAAAIDAVDRGLELEGDEAGEGKQPGEAAG